MTDWELKRYEDAKLAYYALMMFYPMTLEDLPGEEWKPIPGLDGYQVSTFGRVKSFKQGKVKIKKPVLSKEGYLFTALCKNGKAKLFRIHRLIAKTFIPNPENKPEVNHIDGVKMNNFVGNLEWATSLENQQHAVCMGLQKSGADMYNSKFTNEQILLIRENSGNLTVLELSKHFKTSTSIISKIQSGKSYKNAGGRIREIKPRKTANFLTDEQKVEIRKLYIKGDAQFGAVALSKIYDVHPDTIRVVLGVKKR